MQVSFVSRPLNHRVWTLIYLCCFLLGFCIQGYGENTEKINRPEHIQYTWKLLETFERTIHFWRIFNGTPNHIEVKATQDGNRLVPDNQPTPPNTPKPGR